MDVLRKGQQGLRVSELQEMLKRQGYPVQPDGIFGQQTFLAVCRFQEENGLAQDGIVGKDTWEAITGKGSNAQAAKGHAETTVPASTEKQLLPVYEESARLLNVEEAAIRAVCEIESGGRSGFLGDGRPIILFEGHIFWQELKKRGIDTEKYRAGYGDVLFPKWDKSSYRGGVAEYDRLNKASVIDEAAALCSASWGMFQIMGFNHRLCGYDTVREYVDAIKSDSGNHLRSFVRFLKTTGIDQPLRNLDWAGFAARYNGSSYRQNRYDEKLQNAYLKYKRLNGNL